jgi:hypothetical protein
MQFATRTRDIELPAQEQPMRRPCGGALALYLDFIELPF